MKNINLPSALALLGVVVMAGAQSARANELVTNGGFETDSFSGWTQSGDTNPLLTKVNSDAPHSGTYEAFLGPFTEGFLSQSLSTTAGSTYVLDFWLKNVGGNPNLFSVSWNGSSIYNQSNQAAFSYTEFTYDVTATGTSTNLQFGFDNATMFYLDDVSVTPIVASGVPDSGTTASLLGLAMLGLAAVRRKMN